MGNILGMSPPDPPPNVPALPPRAADATGNAKEPTMRQKMLDHRVRSDCAQCHSMMDPIGFALEPFDGVALKRALDEGQAIDPKSKVFDGTEIDGPSGLRNWLVSKYSDQFVEVAAEKLLTYALGRGVDYQDMPLVRSIAHDASKHDNRFSALVLDVVKSKAFQMNTKTRRPRWPPGEIKNVSDEEAPPAARSSAAARCSACQTRLDDSGCHRICADGRCQASAALRRHLLPARHGAGLVGAGRKALGDKLPHILSRSRAERSDDDSERSVVEVGGAAGGTTGSDHWWLRRT